jgi:hypothetical protein
MGYNIISDKFSTNFTWSWLSYNNRVEEKSIFLEIKIENI